MVRRTFLILILLISFPISSYAQNSWTEQTSPTSNTLWDVVSNNNLLVAVGDLGTIVTSTNGTDWTKETLNTTKNLKSVLWSGTQFIAVGGSGVSNEPVVILTSSTGRGTWNEQVVNTDGVPNDLIKLPDGFSSDFLAVGTFGVAEETCRFDESSLTSWSCTDSGSSSALNTVTCRSDNVCLAGGISEIAKSQNQGLSWTVAAVPTPDIIGCVYSDNTNTDFFCGGINGLRICTDPNAGNFYEQAFDFAATISSCQKPNDNPLDALQLVCGSGAKCGTHQFETSLFEVFIPADFFGKGSIQGTHIIELQQAQLLVAVGDDGMILTTSAAGLVSTPTPGGVTSTPTSTPTPIPVPAMDSHHTLVLVILMGLILLFVLPRGKRIFGKD